MDALAQTILHFPCFHVSTQPHTYTHTVPTIIDMLADADNIPWSFGIAVRTPEQTMLTVMCPAHKSSRTQSITIVHVNWLLSAGLSASQFKFGWESSLSVAIKPIDQSIRVLINTPFSSPTLPADLHYSSSVPLFTLFAAILWLSFFTFAACC